jgi:hypothetical protein
MEIKPEMNNVNQEQLTKKSSNPSNNTNLNINEEIKESTISEMTSINKIFSNANSIIMPNVILYIILFQKIKFK